MAFFIARRPFALSVAEIGLRLLKTLKADFSDYGLRVVSLSDFSELAPGIRPGYCFPVFSLPVVLDHGPKSSRVMNVPLPLKPSAFG